MTSCILFVFEGEQPEKMIFNNIKRNFFNNAQNIIFASYKAEIYQLRLKLKDNEYLDTLELLKERDNSGLENIVREQISEIHLFFDHDAHSHTDTMTLEEYSGILRQMLDTLNDEYGQGKLWISYPMAEALKHCKKDIAACFSNCVVSIADNKKYKALINSVSDYRDIRRITAADWDWLIAVHALKAHCFLENTYRRPDCTVFFGWFEKGIQKLIHEKQIEKCIAPEGKTAVFSAFPFFLLYYFGEALYRKAAWPDTSKPCNFSCLASVPYG
jgi:hypothetical protein